MPEPEDPQQPALETVPHSGAGQRPSPDRPSEAPARRFRARDSITLKIFVLGILTLGLWIPLLLTQQLVREREQRKQTVVGEIASSWGRGQTLIGPVVSFRYVCARPIETRPTERSCRDRRSHSLRRMPSEAHWQASLEPEVRRRGIYEAVVWQGTVRFDGTFQKPPSEIRRDGWVYALTSGQIVLGLKDQVGLLDGSSGTLDGDQVLDFETGDGSLVMPSSGLHATLPSAWIQTRHERLSASRESANLSLELNLRGTEHLRFTPGSDLTTATVSSTWPSPGFSGVRLPTHRQISPDGFTAEWQIAGDSHSTPDQWWDENHAPASSLAQAFGVDLVNPVDGYQLTDRATKYGMLFLVLTFTAFFLLEISGPHRLHPIQYLLVGAAQCVFYLLLLSLTEQLGFGISYTLSTTGTIAIISLYALGVSQSRTWFALVAGSLTALYVYLYVLLELEDFALLMGSLGLFVVVAAIMWLTRRFDWYEPQRSFQTS